ncbi:hypothetical protein I3843_09G157000 [Carya illinoinensis]|uniref:Uncharacterized protein n=1 Tax=Carya illinoinensis TaxID=32201 RepID=A0A922J9E8_CARIL|nr:uncharacterized protein LOC122275086 isoform X4 [Carya illinoinensis]KAG6696714.1 hypothetical protein I3842_09G162200 [Carya illinoinensis]KAG7964191.1 hypothetical protein I3843_09G157000 [Carya illinoinensis]
MMLANPRRNSYPSGQSSEGPMFQSSSHSHSISSFVLHFLKKPHAFPFLLSIFLFLTWLSLRLQHASHFSPTSYELKSSQDDDNAANLVRFSSGFPSPLAKDKRGGAVSCASVHVGEIRPGNVRGNHRHHTCNETFVMWGAKTKFRPCLCMKMKDKIYFARHEWTPEVERKYYWRTELLIKVLLK